MNGPIPIFKTSHIVGNERVAMMELAVRVVENFLHRGTSRFGLEEGGTPKDERELTVQEKSCYGSAMNFLQRQFADGWRDLSTQTAKPGDVPEDPVAKDPAKDPA